MDTQKKLIKQIEKEIQKFPVVDAHEHIGHEQERTEKNWDIFTLLFEAYIGGDLLAAGLPQKNLDTVMADGASVGEKWQLLRDVWPFAKHTGYGRVISLALKKFFGEDDFADGGAERATECLRKQNVPGIYKSVLVDTCNIHRVLNQNLNFVEIEPGEEELFSIVVRPSGLGRVDRAIVESEAQRAGKELMTFDAFLESINNHVKQLVADGAVGVKIVAWDMEYSGGGEKTPAQQQSAFQRVMQAPVEKADHDDVRVLTAGCMHALADVARDMDIVVAVHTGAAWMQWLDFRAFDPKHLIPLLSAHRDNRFDVYHAGIPWSRDLAKIAKIYPNTWLNLTWAHIISPEITVNFLDELLDLVPSNKVLGFGGDFCYCVENIYGHLVLARENIARVLARRIDRSLLTMDEALKIAHSWLWENVIKLYRPQ